MCGGSEAGSYSRLTYFAHHSTLGLRAIKKKRMARRYLGCLRPAISPVLRSGGSGGGGGNSLTNPSTYS